MYFILILNFSIDDIEVNLRDLPELSDRLADVGEETLRYSQLATAQDNLKHLFMVPETVINTETAIVEGKLLDAHKALSELEQSRDDLVCKPSFKRG
jgi:exocyst complex component 3